MNDWSVSGSHRRFFDIYASENNFDALVPENWYKVERKDIMEKVNNTPLRLLPLSSACNTRSSLASFGFSLLSLLQGAGLITGHYKRSFADALMTNYPDIGLDPGKFKLKSSTFLPPTSSHQFPPLLPHFLLLTFIPFSLQRSTGVILPIERDSSTTSRRSRNLTHSFPQIGTVLLNRT